jgi:hypothetical protein
VRASKQSEQYTSLFANGSNGTRASSPQLAQLVENVSRSPRSPVGVPSFGASPEVLRVSFRLARHAAQRVGGLKPWLAKKRCSPVVKVNARLQSRHVKEVPADVTKTPLASDR